MNPPESIESGHIAGRRRIAVVWNYSSPLRECSFRFEQYIAGFQALGHEAVMVCTAKAAEGFEAPYHLCDSRERFADTSFWREVGADTAVIATWHGMSEVLAAMKSAGTSVVAFADTDGQSSLQVFPLAVLRMNLSGQTTAGSYCLTLAKGLLSYAHQRLAGSSRDEECLRSTRLSDLVVFGHEAGKGHFERFLRHCEAPDLSSRLAVVPFTIGSVYFTCPVPSEKDDAVAAIGRWDSPQKHAGLLSAALSRLLEERPHTRVDLFGSGGAAHFQHLVKRYPSVTYHGLAGPEILARTLSRARSIVFSSRWEGCPHAALEALAMGATVVGPPLPSLESWSEGGRFGGVSRRRTAGSMSRALLLEMRAWDEGLRDGQAIAAAWRDRLKPETVCRQLLSRF